jgi:OmpA-OmpF porin, OOP family
MMKKNLLGLALLSAVSLSQVAVAQEYDNRWYISGSAGVLVTDQDRELTNGALFGIGFGKRVSPNWAFDLEYNRTDPSWQHDFVLGLEQDLLVSVDPSDVKIEAIEATARYYFVKADRTWDPYIAFGLGYEQDSGSAILADAVKVEFDDSGLLARLGAGVQTNRMKRVDFRLEGGLRYAGSKDYSVDVSDGEGGRESLDIIEGSSFLDYYATASLLVKLGNLPVPVVAAPITCDTLDSDGDGVNDCNDKCPDSSAGQTIGADGCPVKLSIDLKGVNFDFDKATLRPDAVVILDEAVAVLAKYPELRFEVAGHTDLCGDEGHNQGLSERRAQTVYDYLTSKGIDAARMVGPTGYGESRPLESTEQTFPACKNETNRRTELNVQN